jgi:hypothetical protein
MWFRAQPELGGATAPSSRSIRQSPALYPIDLLQHIERMLALPPVGLQLRNAHI